ncbi:stalk domain-containing protein [Tepidibacillus infernus]|uniref:stalk domain-containing protein n=1 Tax=Tepidibacillus infernus TaxID=1806172 RepID=UPI003B6BC759
MNKKWFTLIFVIMIVFSFTPQLSFANPSLQKGMIEVDGIRQDMDYLFNNHKVYLPLSAIAKKLEITSRWNSGTNTITLFYPDQRKVNIKVKSKQFYKEGLWRKLDIILLKGTTYISLNELSPLIERQVHWDEDTKTLFIYMYAYQQQGQSINNDLPYQGLDVIGNQIQFKSEDLPQASWSLNGDLTDFRLIGNTKQTNMEEFRFVAFYQLNQTISQLVITQRKLPTGDQIFFIKIYSPKGDQQLKVNIEENEQVYGSRAYHYIDHDPLHTWLSEDEYQSQDTLNIKAGESLDQWYILSKEKLELEDPFVKRAWEISENYHKTNTWVTAEGTHRYTPIEYQDKEEYHNKNISLQASVPMLLIETLQIKPNRLLEDFVDNAKFTLIKMQREDGFWRAGVNAAYLNRAYGLGPNYIDTRMSVDASLFLIRYGLMYDDQEALEKGMQFKNYFKQLKEIGIVYQLNGGYLYPDYYSEQQRGKTLVSLNHALYEINYLYALYHWLQDEEAKQLADEMLTFIENSADHWVNEDGDLYYALSPAGKYYGEDYVNITYMDLFTTQGILRYSGKDDSMITKLFAQKGNYLDQIQSPEYESHLHLNHLFEKFDQSHGEKGDLFLSYPLEVKAANDAELAYTTFGAYHWMKGIESITFKGQKIPLDPKKKYMVVITNDKLYLYDRSPEDPLVKVQVWTDQ